MGSTNWLKSLNSIDSRTGDILPINLRDTLIDKPKIYAEKILGEEAVTASITMPIQQLSPDGQTLMSQTVTIPFYMENDFSIGQLTNKWSDLVDMNNLEIVSKFLNMMVGPTTGSAQVAMQSEAMSTKVWQGSDFSGFTVNCLFIATNRRINPTKIIRTLASSTLPTKAKGDSTGTVEDAMVITKASINWVVDKAVSLGNFVIGGADALVSHITKDGFDEAAAKEKLAKAGQVAKDAVEEVGMVAPLHYGIESDGNGRAFKPINGTTLTLQVGNYFRATELLVQSIGGITFSKEVIAPKAFNEWRSGDLYNPKSTGETYDNVYGFPLYGKCTLNLIPCSMMTKDKFEGYFIDKNAEATDGIFSFISDSFSKFSLPSPQ